MPSRGRFPPTRPDRTALAGFTSILDGDGRLLADGVPVNSVHVSWFEPDRSAWVASPNTSRRAALLVVPGPECGVLAVTAPSSQDRPEGGLARGRGGRWQGRMVLRQEDDAPVSVRPATVRRDGLGAVVSGIKGALAQGLELVAAEVGVADVVDDEGAVHADTSRSAAPRAAASPASRSATMAAMTSSRRRSMSACQAS